MFQIFFFFYFYEIKMIKSLNDARVHHVKEFFISFHFIFFFLLNLNR